MKKHDAERHFVRPDGVYSTSVLQAIPGFQPVSNAHQIAQRFTAAPYFATFFNPQSDGSRGVQTQHYNVYPPGAPMAGLGYPNFAPINSFPMRSHFVHRPHIFHVPTRPALNGGLGAANHAHNLQLLGAMGYIGDAAAAVTTGPSTAASAPRMMVPLSPFDKLVYRIKNWLNKHKNVSGQQLIQQISMMTPAQQQAVVQAASNPAALPSTTGALDPSAPMPPTARMADVALALTSSSADSGDPSINAVDLMPNRMTAGNLVPRVPGYADMLAAQVQGLVPPFVGHQAYTNAMNYWNGVRSFWWTSPLRPYGG